MSSEAPQGQGGARPTPPAQPPPASVTPPPAPARESPPHYEHAAGPWWAGLVEIALVLLLLGGLAFGAVVAFSTKIRAAIGKWFGADAGALGSLHQGLTSVISGVGSNLNSIGQIIEYLDPISDIEKVAAAQGAPGEVAGRGQKIVDLLNSIKADGSKVVSLVFQDSLTARGLGPAAGKVFVFGASNDSAHIALGTDERWRVYWVEPRLRPIVNFLFDPISMSLSNTDHRRQTDYSRAKHDYYSPGYRMWQFITALIPETVPGGFLVKDLPAGASDATVFNRLPVSFSVTPAQYVGVDPATSPAPPPPKSTLGAGPNAAWRIALGVPAGVEQDNDVLAKYMNDHLTALGAGGWGANDVNWSGGFGDWQNVADQFTA